MDCAAVKPKMEALVSGALPESERELAEQHISICEGCRLELELVRAIGSQEKPPSGGSDDWTLDRIFGAEGKQGGGAKAPSAPPEAKSDSPASVFPGMEPAKSVADANPTDGNASDSAPAEDPDSSMEEKPAAPASWDFEPADAKGDVKPPLESLFFANEALTRSKETGAKKGSSLRVILWAVGGLIGACLLAASSWFVLQMSAPSSENVPAIDPPPSTDGSGETPGRREGTDPPSLEPAPQDEVPELPDNTAQQQPATRPTRASTSPTQPTPIPSSTSTRVTAPTQGQTLAPTRTSAPQTTQTAPGTTTSKPSRLPPPPPASIPRPKPWIPPPDDDAPAPAPRSEPVQPQTRFVEPAPSEGADSEDREPASEEPAAKPQAQERPANSSWLESQAGSKTPAPSTGSKPSSLESLPENATPLEKLRFETLRAEEENDLATLRRLRSSWKAFISKMGVGPLRSNAKRDYADCLWAIQTLTGSRADQKSALAAYREYLLGAPAGGADSRSVTRLRQLEDALTERR